MAARKKSVANQGRGKGSSRAKDAKWSGKIKTDSTHPPEGLFTKDAQTVARVMATKKVSPGGIGSAIRMIQMFINRAGKSLPTKRRKELEEAKHLLQAKERTKQC